MIPSVETFLTIFSSLLLIRRAMLHFRGNEKEIDIQSFMSISRNYIASHVTNSS